MPKDYAKAKQHTHSRKRGIILILVILILFIFSLIIIKHHKTKKIPKKLNIHITQQKQKNTSSPPLHFDFYTILPKEQIDITKLSPSKSTYIQYFLQISAVQNPNAADHLRAELSLLGFDVFVEKATIDNKIWYRVNIGPYSSEQAAKADQKRLIDNNIKSIIKTLKNDN